MENIMQLDKRVSIKLCFVMIIAVSLVYGVPFGSFLENRFHQETRGIGGVETSLPETSMLFTEKAEEESLKSAEAEVSELELYYKVQPLLSISYQVQKGDTIGAIAKTFGLNQDTIISLNGIKNTRLLQIGQILKIANQDGILHTVKKGETLAAIADKYESNISGIETVNELFSDKIPAGGVIFIPGAQLDRVALQEINGDLFIWPVRGGYITSLYGYRKSPFTAKRQFHTGLDIGSPQGTPVMAGMAGRVSATGYDATLGNYVIINHHSSYRTLYAHLSVIRVKSGAYVRTGERIGDVGSTGLSTGPHLHFTVYKNGARVNPRTLIR